MYACLLCDGELQELITQHAVMDLTTSNVIC